MRIKTQSRLKRLDFKPESCQRGTSDRLILGFQQEVRPSGILENGTCLQMVPYRKNDFSSEFFFRCCMIDPNREKVEPRNQRIRNWNR